MFSTSNLDWQENKKQFFCAERDSNTASFQKIRWGRSVLCALPKSVFSKKSKLSSYYNIGRKKGGCAGHFLEKSTAKKAGTASYGQTVNL